jgi:hypothetical protein
MTDDAEKLMDPEMRCGLKRNRTDILLQLGIVAPC